MDAKSLKRLLPRNKDDAEAARALVALGYPAVEPLLPQMLDWLKSIGSPVDLVMRDFFVALGAHAMPVVQRALRSRHDTLKYAVVMNVVAKWPVEAIAPLKVQLQALATGPGFYGTDLIALRLLVEHRLADHDWLKAWAQFKTKRLRELLSEAEKVEALLAK
jgi:Domain of unknown function (DUF5071)